MDEIIERPFELRCPHCESWTNIHCTDEELGVKSLNRTCPDCGKALNWYLPSEIDETGTIILQMAYTVQYRRKIIL